MFSCEFCEIFKKTFFARFLRATASVTFGRKALTTFGIKTHNSLPHHIKSAGKSRVI